MATQQEAYEELTARLADRSQDGELQARVESQSALIRKLEASLRESNATNDRLRDSLRARSQALRETEDKVASLKADRAMITKDLVAFESDLRVQRVESEQFGVELQLFKRAEEAAKDAHRSQLARVQADCQSAQDRLDSAKRQLEATMRRVAELEQARDQNQGNM